MGCTIEVLCNNCNFRKVFNLGRTANKASAFEVLKYYSMEVISTIKQMDAAYNMIDYDYEESIYVCRRCYHLDNKMTLKISFQDSSEFTPKYFCKKCKTNYKVIEELENIKTCNCPSCGSFTLRYKKICNWD